MFALERSLFRCRVGGQPIELLVSSKFVLSRIDVLIFSILSFNRIPVVLSFRISPPLVEVLMLKCVR